MCLDLFFVQVVEKTKIPVLRFYGWNPFCISLGHHQKTENINFDKIQSFKADIVRRPTGGSAIYHAQELTYSLIIPRAGMTHHDLYFLFHNNLTAALNSLNIPVVLETGTDKTYLNQGNDTFACFNRAAKSEIKYKGKKVVGSAQKLYPHIILQHGSILMGNAHTKIIKFLNLNEEETVFQQDKLKNSSVSIEEISENKINPLQIADLLVNNLQKSLKINNICYKYTEPYELKSAMNFYDKVKVNPDVKAS